MVEYRKTGLKTTWPHRSNGITYTSRRGDRRGLHIRLQDSAVLPKEVYGTEQTHLPMNAGAQASTVCSSSPHPTGRQSRPRQLHAARGNEAGTCPCRRRSAGRDGETQPQKKPTLRRNGWPICLSGLLQEATSCLMLGKVEELLALKRKLYQPWPGVLWVEMSFLHPKVKGSITSLGVYGRQPIKVSLSY